MFPSTTLKETEEIAHRLVLTGKQMIKLPPNPEDPLQRLGSLFASGDVWWNVAGLK